MGDILTKGAAEASALLEELVPEASGDPKSATSVPKWFAYLIEWADLAIQAKDRNSIRRRFEP